MSLPQPMDQGPSQMSEPAPLDDEILFLDESEGPSPVETALEPWKLLIIDDEEQVHAVTRLALRRFQFDHKSLDILSAYSATEAKQILEQHVNIAALVLDVVMETDQAGLELIKYIRQDLNNQWVQIILRTGQPGVAPEISVIEDYDINNYTTKTELTQTKLFSMLITALRAHRNMIVIDQNLQEIRALNQKLQDFNQELEQLVQIRTQELELRNKQLQQEMNARQVAQEKLQTANRKLADANKQLALIANQDGLTRLATRRRFDQHLQQLWKQAQRDQQALTLILCDIDYFKRYNDTYGHPAGDACLRRVAQAIYQVVARPLDLAARYGGEEFAVLLFNTNLDGGTVVAQNILAAVRQLHLPHAASSVSDHLTLSLGVAAVSPVATMAPQVLVDAADAALYQAKEGGRDRMVSQLINS